MIRRRMGVFDRIKQLKKEDIDILHVSHDIFDLSDRASVLKNGQLLGAHRTDIVTQNDVFGIIIIGNRLFDERLSEGITVCRCAQQTRESRCKFQQTTFWNTNYG
jgi:ABC-type sugar transport system ATPase subunit